MHSLLLPIGRLALIVGMLYWPSACLGDALPPIAEVEAQPFKSQVRRVVASLEFLGESISAEQRAALTLALDEVDDAKAVAAIQKVLDERVLAAVTINPESRVKAARGPAEAELVEQGWRVFLVKVHNEAGVTAKLRVSSRNAEPLHAKSSSKAEPESSVRPEDVPDRWADLDMFQMQPMNAELSGLAVEYRILQVYSRDRGRREAAIAFDVGQGTQDLGFRNEVAILFQCAPAVKVTLQVLDDDGQPTSGHFVFRDALGRVYPARSRRLAPDFFFHDQVYRHDGEFVLLPPGKYEATSTRGPEYIIQKRQIEIPLQAEHTESFRLKRWIKLADYRWYSGDHHVHAAGCAHYEAPTQGVSPEDMMRHILGEDLNVGCILSWGPCWYHQKQFFDGKVHQLSTSRNVMRYDVEVSGFPSSHAGHLCLLGLSEDDFPGTTRIEEWPSWDLPVLQWAKDQGAVVGFAHSGWGLELPDDALPNYNLPAFDGIGANEYVVDVVHGACDFISAVDTPSVWELNVWYHTLNCGYECRISGETDFPCIYGERVGLGRIYVRLDGKQPLNYADWLEGVRDGRSYCCDGLSHLFDFRVNHLGVGEAGHLGRKSVLHAKSGQPLKISLKAAALLENEPREDIRQKELDEKPYWHIERARIDRSRKAPVELIVNGLPVERREITADGAVEEIEFEYTPPRSSWIAVRIFPSAHTNPVFVELDGKPVRASKRSAQWCLDAVEKCWQSKRDNIREQEREAARAAYDVARSAYASILDASYDDRPAAQSP